MKASQKCYESSARQLPSLSLSLLYTHPHLGIHTSAHARTHALTKVLRGPRTCQMRSRQIIGFFFAHGHQLKQYAVYAHGPKLNNEVWHSMPVFISEVKKENRTKKKNEHGDICFLINYKFLCKISFKLISFFVSVVTLCDIFYSRFKRFFGLNVFFTK